MSTHRQNASLYHNAYQPLSLGCLGCKELGVCGGLHTRESLFDCLSFCRCSDRSNCQYVCPRKLDDFVNRTLEVGDFGFENIPRIESFSSPKLPLVVPHLYNKSRRSGRLVAEAVSVPLSVLFDHKTGKAKFTSKREVAAALGFDPRAALVISGVGEDQGIEDYWTHRLAERIPEHLAALRPALVTAPNFSLFLDSPRWDNLYSMKRIAICWAELISEGIPASLHLNSRTDRDWERWIDFVGEREEVQSISFEFRTGAALQERASFHVEKLCLLASMVRRDIQLVVRGGYNHLQELAKVFSKVVFIDTTSFIKTVKRQRLDWYPGGKGNWRSARTPKLYPLDELLLHNVKSFAKMVSYNLLEGAF